ncbi:hypothetical protein ABZ912_46025 [Nonomuraea angiospora]|uniref:hypothetical protein n=1 Tax=Nonomuraea angiospora TaxID=46172 RepID=UPI0033D3E252
MRRLVPWLAMICLGGFCVVSAVQAWPEEDPDPPPTVRPAARLPALPGKKAPRLDYAVLYDPGVIREPAAAHYSWRAGSGSGQEWRIEDALGFVPKDGGQAVSPLAISDDGRRLAYLRRSDRALVVKDLAGGAAKRISTRVYRPGDDPWNVELAFQGDSELLFVWNADRGSELIDLSSKARFRVGVEFASDLLDARADGGRVSVVTGKELRVRENWKSPFTVAQREGDAEDDTHPVVLGDEAVSVVRLGDMENLRYQLKSVDLRHPAHRVTSANLALPYDLETVNAIRPLGRDSVLLRAERSRTWPDHGYPPGPCDWEEFYIVNLKTGAIRWADYRAAEIWGAEGKHIKRQAYARDFVPKPITERPVPAQDRERCL